MVQTVKASACNERDSGSIPGPEDPWRRDWQPTPVVLPRESHRNGAWRATVHGVARVRHNLATNTHTMWQQ